MTCVVSELFLGRMESFWKGWECDSRKLLGRFRIFSGGFLIFLDRVPGRFCMGREWIGNRVKNGVWVGNG